VLVIPIKADNVDDIIAVGVDEIRIYRATSLAGTYTLVGTVTLIPGQEDYEFVDENGLPSHYYESTYYDTTKTLESPKSNPVLGSPIIGPLGLLNVDNVRNLTDFAGVTNLSDTKLGQLIFRAESLLQRFADRYGGWATQVAGNQTLAIAARLLLEELYLRSLPAARAAQALGLVSEKIGSYMYSKPRGMKTSATTGDPWDIRQYFSPEVIDALRTLVVVSPTKVTMNTTFLFPQLDPIVDVPTGFFIRPYWDGIDEELTIGTPLHNSRTQRVIIAPQR
jgi:hypothetical protein